jgi:UDP-N-acetylglucosamine 3-dehydrogenase
MKVGIIGIGYIGIHHLRNLKRLMDEGYLDRIYASDVDPSRKAYADKYDAIFYSNYSEMIRDAKPDLIILSVPTRYHYKMGLEILRNNINLFLEKPMCTKSRECKELIEEAEKRNLFLTVGHIERFNPIVKKLIKFIDDGLLGNIISMAARRHGGPRKVDTGILLDIGVHDIDIMRHITGKRVRRVYSYTIKKLRDVANEDYAVVILEFDDGIVGTVEVGRLTSVKVRELNIIGTRNYISLDYINQEFTIVENYLEGGGWRDFMDFILKSAPIRKTIKADGEEPLYIELYETIKSLENGQPPPVSPYDGLRAVEISEKALKSSKLGVPLEV